MIKLAQIQYSPLLGDINGNPSRVKTLLSECKEPELIILPELSDTGYNFPNKKYALKQSMPIDDNPFINLLLNHATKYKSHLVSGFCEKRNKKLFNSSILIGPDGILGIYQKIHLFMNEKDIFSEGSGGLLVYDLGDYKLGMQICFDYLFPEPWNILAHHEADIIAHPSNLVTHNAFKVIPALSVINKVFIATTNRMGSDAGLLFAGKSFLSNPNGEIISTASESKEEILITEFEPAISRNKMITSRNHVFKDRRPDKYK